MIGNLSEIQNRLKWSTEPSIMFETGLIKLCLMNEDKKNSSETKETVKTVENKPDENTENDLAQKVLTNLKENGKIRLHANLLNTKIELMQDGIVHIVFNGPIDALTKGTFQKEETKIAIKEAVIAAVGRDVSVKYDNLK